MATPRLVALTERLAWILVYGGLFSMLLGWVTQREEATTGAWLLAAGAAATVLGIVLIVVRSRLRPASAGAREQGKT